MLLVVLRRTAGRDHSQRPASRASAAVSGPRDAPPRRSAVMVMMVVVGEVQLEAVVVVLVVMVVVTAAAPVTTFLAVARDMAPPPLVTSFTTKTNGTTVSANLAQCGQLCFAATVERCLAFVWRPLTLPVLTSTNTINSSSGRELGLEGSCEFLSCLPHPASLVAYPGAQLFVVKTGDSPSPPPAFKPSLVPESYSMACTFAFKVFSVPELSQWQASKHCAQDGARLAVFKSYEDEAAVSLDVRHTESYWIGLTDSQREGTWRWADRSEVKYSNWDTGQPNNFARGREDQDCVVLFKGRWNDRQCRQTFGFICQVPLLYR
ncbi:uncharacterized protein LOC126986289 isoform X2 [Eriocheir sinensis]|uniref:uncharacterized protein LOC126986289 isoform X2 n=1 Tax=Eriocheir sinensis TaxID=95602 RepID=UPI0021C60201|nr:uncharacterized protein LOC126986289 isoform X2 [Eriocheir sinensis]